MGDHRPTITADFEMHGHKAHFDFGYCNWSPNSDGVDQRVVDWFALQADIAISRWRDGVEADSRKNAKEASERREREELARLKSKYET